jgi:hypothetical protein
MEPKKPTMQDALQDAYKTMSLAWYVLLLKKLGVRQPRVWREAV